MARTKNSPTSKNSSKKKDTKPAKKTREKKVKAIPARPPQVNLLPPRLEFERNKQITKRTMSVIAAGFVVSCLVLLGGQLVLNFMAQQQVTAQQDRLSAVEDNLADYTHIENFLNTIGERRTLVSQLQGAQLNYVNVSNAMFDVLPVGANVSSVKLSLLESSEGTPQDKAGKCGAVVDPIGIAGADIVGCFSATITAPLSTSAAALTEQLAASPLLVNVDISEVQGTTTPAPGEETVAASKQLTITAAIVREGLLRDAIVAPSPKAAAAESENVDE